MYRFSTVEELVRTSTILTGDLGKSHIIPTIVEQSQDVSRSDLAAIYLFAPDGSLKRTFRRGRFDTPKELAGAGELAEFMGDAAETLILHDRDRPFFGEAFLHDAMRSAIVVPIRTPDKFLGILVLNHRNPHYYGKERLAFLDSFAKLGAGIIHNNELIEDLAEQYRRVDQLQRYQASIFESMTNLLVTTDKKGNIHYFNQAAADALGLTEDNLEANLEDFLEKRVGKRAMKIISNVRQTDELVLGYEGIFKGDQGDMDFSLNVAPLRAKRSGNEGLTLLFTDQTRERELKSQMEQASEERRVIKDMFSRYLSQEVLNNLMENPQEAALGGDKKFATLFFADIRGYTSFSEGKEPEYIVEVLNEYFSQAVEVVIKYNGYIDKFIGDCIMAAWGVPMYTEEEDAVSAVSCAVEIQHLVNSPKRTFFRGKASHLRVGIGMQSGPLVAGNLGGSRRMDYSVIGDTVNVAARLEGVAGPGEVIITEVTRELVGDHFKLKELEPVKVKGKEKPLHIFSVLDRVK